MVSLRVNLLFPLRVAPIDAGQSGGLLSLPRPEGHPWYAVVVTRATLLPDGNSVRLECTGLLVGYVHELAAAGGRAFASGRRA